MNERERSQAQRHQQQAHGDQFWFAHFFDQPPDGAALDDRADYSGVGKKEIDRSFVVHQVESEIPTDQKAEGRLKAGETKGRQKENPDDERDFWMIEGMGPLFEARALARMFGAGFPTLWQNSQGEKKVGGAESCGDPARSGQAPGIWADPANQWSAD